MKHHQLKQGSHEWREHRAKFKNASDTPVIMGLSKYKTRTQFMNERLTGVVEEVTPEVQSRFDDGHKFEALARPVAENIIGKELYPVTGSEGEFGASFDGLTMNEDIAFEHKTLNAELRAAESAADLDEMYLVQMEHQLMVSGAEKCLFMASKWDVNNILLEEVHFWYEQDIERRQRIVDAWAQLDIDMESHEVVEIIEKPKGEAVLELPALFIQATGAIIASNMKEFGAALNERMEQARAVALVNDQDFANAKTLAKNIRDGIVQIKKAKNAMLEQTATVGETSRMIDEWAENMRITALKLESDVTAEDKLKKQLMINDVQGSFTTIIQTLEEKVRPIRLNIIMPDFASAIKGKSKYASMQDAIDTLFAKSESEARRLASDIAEKIGYLNVVGEDYQFLFLDLQHIIFKADDDFKLLVNSRIKNHREAELAKEAKIKADAEAALLAKQAAEAVAPTVTKMETVEKPLMLPESLQPEFGNIFTPAIVPTQYFKGATPTVNEIVTALASAFKVDELQAHKYLIDADFTQYKIAA